MAGNAECRVAPAGDGIMCSERGKRDRLTGYSQSRIIKVGTILSDGANTKPASPFGSGFPVRSQVTSGPFRSFPIPRDGNGACFLFAEFASLHTHG